MNKLLDVQKYPYIKKEINITKTQFMNPLGDPNPK